METFRISARDDESHRTNANHVERLIIEFDDIKYVLTRDVLGNLTINKTADEPSISVHPHVSNQISIS